VHVVSLRGSAPKPQARSARRALCSADTG